MLSSSRLSPASPSALVWSSLDSGIRGGGLSSLPARPVVRMFLQFTLVQSSRTSQPADPISPRHDDSAPTTEPHLELAAPRLQSMSSHLPATAGRAILSTCRALATTPALRKQDSPCLKYSLSCGPWMVMVLRRIAATAGSSSSYYYCTVTAAAAAVTTAELCSSCCCTTTTTAPACRCHPWSTARPETMAPLASGQPLSSPFLSLRVPAP